jgi:glycosyltransferase involved in cell wall biosynthesis
MNDHVAGLYMKKSVALLLKTDVRRINLDYSPGGERVFLDDAIAFFQRSMLTHAYVAGSIYTGSSHIGKKIQRLPYFHWIIDFLEECEYAVKRKWVVDMFRRSKEIIYIMFEFCYALTFVLLERNTDIYYVFDCPLVALLSPAKTVLAFHNFHGNLSYIFRLKQRMSRVTILFPSVSLKDEYLKRYPDISTDSCIVIPNAVDVSVFKPSNTKPKKITFLFASAWVKEKGVEYINFVVRELNKHYLHTIDFIIGGSVDLWSLSKRRYRTLHDIDLRMHSIERLYPNVKLIGRVCRKDMPRLYQGATYVLFPSLWREPCALMLFESLACGVPVIAFAKGGTKEIIFNNENGFLIPGVNKQDYLHTLQHLIESFDNKEYTNMSKRCRFWAQKHEASKRIEQIMHLPVFSVNT